MKNNLIKYYIAAFYFCSIFVMVAQGDTSPDGLESDGDTTPMPIDDYVWVLALVAIALVFVKFRSIQNKKING